MVRAVIFDLDDTLYPELEFVKSGFVHVARYISGITDLSESVVYRHIWREFTRDSRCVFNRVLEQMGIFSQDLLEMLIGIYRSHKPSIILPAESEECINWLKKRGIKTGIITDGYLVTQKNKVEALGLDRVMDLIIYTDSLGREHWKPSTKAFEMAAKQLGCSPVDCVYIGDNPTKDFLPGNKIGMITIQLITGDGVYKDAKQPLPEGQARYTINCLMQLKDYIMQEFSAQKEFG